MQLSRNVLVENGGPMALTAKWAKSLLHRLHYVKRKGSSVAKISVTNFEELRKQFIKVVREMEDVPPELIMNWDQTTIRVIPCQIIPT
jgi:hypothetical protein